jgi:hypothetical protein
MHLMPTSAQPTLTRPMSTSRLACSFCKTASHLRPLRTALHRCPAISILKPTSLLRSTDQLLLNGALLNPSSHLKVLHHQLSAAVDGTDPWLRSATLDCLLSS